MSGPLVLTIDHPAVRLCAAYRFTSQERALALLNDFDVERTRWCAVAEQAAEIWPDRAAVAVPPLNRRRRYLTLIEEMKRVMEEVL
jgi:hypothetical protein